MVAIPSLPSLFSKNGRDAMEATLFNLHFGPVLAMDHGVVRSMSAGRPVAGHNDRQRAFQRHERTAIVPVMGVLVPRTGMSIFDRGFRGLNEVSAAIDAALDDEYVKRIVLHVDSRGGSAFGVPELADKIREANAIKPVVAVADGYMSSGAYWIASGATEIVASPSALAGGIGVYEMHVDISKLEAKRGIKTTLVSAGKHKVENNPYSPMNEAGRKQMQQMVDSAYGQFVRAVSLGRGVSTTAVRSGMGQGRVLKADNAKRAGLVDRVATLETVLGESVARAIAKQRRGSNRTVGQRRLELFRKKHGLN